MLFLKFLFCLALITSSMSAVQAVNRLHAFNATLELIRHNELRAKHGVPPLTLVPELTARAQAYARKLGTTRKFQHSGAKGFGENLYMTTGPYKSPAGTDCWYNEIKNYDFDKGQFSGNTGHFTQVVWKKTTSVGFGFHDGYFVANYAPAGNLLGQFKINVLKLGK